MFLSKQLSLEVRGKELLNLNMKLPQWFPCQSVFSNHVDIFFFNIDVGEQKNWLRPVLRTVHGL